MKKRRVNKDDEDGKWKGKLHLYPNSDTCKELEESSIFCQALPSESDSEYVSSFPLESDSSMFVISSMVEKNSII